MAKRSDVGKGEIVKQTATFLPLSDWKLLRLEAARQGSTMADLLRQWIEPELKRLRRDS